MSKPANDLKDKIKESIKVRGIASSVLHMSLPSFAALNNLLETEGYSLTQIKTNNNESDSINNPN